MCPTSVFKKEMCPTSVFKKEMCPTSVFQKEMCPTSAKVRFWDKRVLFFSCPKIFQNLGSFFEKKLYTKKKNGHIKGIRAGKSLGALKIWLSLRLRPIIIKITIRKGT